MSTPDQQHAPSTEAPVTASKTPLPSKKRWLVRIAAFCVVVALAGSGGYLLHPSAGPIPPDSQLPAFVPLPAHASLVRTETFLKDHVQNWYYTIPHLSEEAGMAFYHSQLAQRGWQCFTSMTNTNMSYYGQALAGTGVYMTALRGTTKAQLYFGDQAYGAWLLQDNLSDNAIALKLSLEPAENAACS